MVSALLRSLLYGSMPGLYYNVPNVANVMQASAGERATKIDAQDIFVIGATNRCALWEC